MSAFTAQWDEQKHPRDPGGEGGGQFIAKGTTAAGGQPEAEDLDPRVTEVGGDDWNKATAVRLAREYRVVRDDLDKLAQDCVEGKVGGVSPVWNTLGQSVQQQVEDHYLAQHGKYTQEDIDKYGAVAIEKAKQADQSANKGVWVQLTDEQKLAYAKKHDFVKPIAVGSIAPQSWDDLSDETKTSIEEAYKEKEFAAALESEKESWYDNGNALDDAKYQLAENFSQWQKAIIHSPTFTSDTTDWLTEALDDYREERKNDELPDIPYTNEQLLKAISLDYEAGSESDPHFDWFTEHLQQPSDIKPLDPNQLELPGMAAGEVDLSSHLDEEMRENLKVKIVTAFNKAADDNSSDMEPPSYLEESAQEMVDNYWNEMSEKESFEWAKENTDFIDEDDGGAAGPIEMPKRFDPLGMLERGNAPSESYHRTQRLARAMSLQRAAELIVERGLVKSAQQKAQELSAAAKALGLTQEAKAAGLMNDEAKGSLLEQTRGHVEFMDKLLWSQWKSASTTQGGELLQLAVADELGGRVRTAHFHNGGREATIAYANNEYRDIGGYEGIKAYIRAKWETTQYLLDKADLQKLQLYRAIDMPVSASEPVEVVKSWHRYPNLTVERNGAASTSAKASVSNGWDGESSPGTTTATRSTTPSRRWCKISSMSSSRTARTARRSPSPPAATATPSG